MQAYKGISSSSCRPVRIAQEPCTQQTDSEPDYAFFRIEVFRPSRDKPFHPAAKELAGGCEKQILVLIVCILPEVIEKVLEVLLVDLKP